MAKLQNILDFIKSPKQAFDKEEKTSVKEAIIFSAVWMIPLVIISAIVSYLMQPYLLKQAAAIGLEKIAASAQSTVVGAILQLPLTYVFALVGLLVLAAWLHLWIYIFGGRESFSQTMKVTAYGNSPSYLFGWVPLIGNLTSLWNAALYVIGATKLQKMSQSKAIFAILISIIIPILLVGLLLFLAIVFAVKYLPALAPKLL